jgi:hypothetical protein
MNTDKKMKARTYYHVYYHPVYSACPTPWYNKKERYPRAYITLDQAMNRLLELEKQHPENTFYLYEAKPIHSTDLFVGQEEPPGEKG